MCNCTRSIRIGQERLNNAEFIWIGAVAQTSNEAIEEVDVRVAALCPAYMCRTCHYR